MTESRYPFVELDVPETQAEMISYALFEAGALGIEERDATTMDQGTSRPGHTTLVVSVPDDAAAASLCSRYADFGARTTHVVGDDWRDAWKAYFKPTRVGSRILLRPSWAEVSPAPHEMVLTVDPGAAFGSGIHETTRLVLFEVDRRVRGDERVLDVGCGSGILAVASLLLGAREAVCIDSDPLAVGVALENAAHNAVGDRLQASTTPISDVTGRFEHVYANIQAHILIGMADALTSRLAPGGVLVLSGILNGQQAEVADVFSPLVGAAPTITHENEWVALTFSASTDAP